MKRQSLLGPDVPQPILDMLQFRFAVAVRMIDPIINDPKAVNLRIHLHTRDHADAFDHSFGIPDILTANQLNLGRISLIHDGIIVHDVPVRTEHNIWPHIVPDQTRRNAIPP
jgi:hypothetical protein